jgi:thioredoxin 1
MDILNVTEENYEEFAARGGAAILDFGAEYCAPCRALRPALDVVAEKFPGVAIGQVDVDASPKLAAQFRVMSIPAIVILRDGKEAARMANPKNAEDILKEDILKILRDAENER